MDHSPSGKVEEFRTRVRQFLADHLPGQWPGVGALAGEERAEFVVRWRALLAEHRLLGIGWPEEYGGAGHGPAENGALQEEFVRVGVPLLPLPSDTFGLNLIGPTILHWGTEFQKSYFLPRILSGDVRFAQGYSEPEAGSDLFGLTTSARLEDGRWIVNGHKVWQSDCEHANWIFVLVRTDTELPKSRSLSLLLLPLDQPGVLVRPIRAMTGQEEFCEVFFDNAVTDAVNIVGQRGQGSHVAASLLGFERSASAAAMHALLRVELDRLVALVRERGRASDPLIRQRIAWCHSKVEILALFVARFLSGTAAGTTPGPESSILKLFESEYHTAATELAMDVLGSAGLARTGPLSTPGRGAAPLGTPNSARAWQGAYLNARAATIYGGSSQIQRTTIGERILGLPREPKPDTRRWTEMAP